MGSLVAERRRGRRRDEGKREERALTTNTELQAHVVAELKWDPKIDASEIAVSATDGAVTLVGFVPDYFQKTKAVAAAERVYGVKAVADELEVRLRGSHVRDDSDIAQSIAHILSSNTVLPAGIQAKVADGVITLTGSVLWDFQREEAARLVDGVIGVKHVINLVTVRPQATVAQVEKEITNALARHAALDARRIRVSTEDGTAVLSGHVHSFEEARLAKQAALSAPGISKVEDHLVVQP